MASYFTAAAVFTHQQMGYGPCGINPSAGGVYATGYPHLPGIAEYARVLTPPLPMEMLDVSRQNDTSNVTTGTVFDDSGTGTITLSGTGTESQTHTASGSGTITLSGSFVQSQTHTASGSGTVTLTGSRTESQTHTASRTGTITLTGSGVEEFIPPSSGATTNTGYDQTSRFIVTH